MADDSSSFLIDSPVYDSLLDGVDKPLNDSWSNWFDSVVEAIGQCIILDFLVDVNMNRFAVGILKPTGGSTAQRNQLENAVDGSTWYNTDTNQFNFRQGGAWVTFTPIPA